MHLTVLFSHFYVKIENVLWFWVMQWLNNGIMGRWTTWLLDFNKRGAWNNCDGVKFGPFLINVVAEITELWVENSQKINCPDVTSMREGRVRE